MMTLAVVHWSLQSLKNILQTDRFHWFFSHLLLYFFSCLMCCFLRPFRPLSVRFYWRDLRLVNDFKVTFRLLTVIITGCGKKMEPSYSLNSVVGAIFFFFFHIGPGKVAIFNKFHHHLKAAFFVYLCYLCLILELDTFQLDKYQEGG